MVPVLTRRAVMAAVTAGAAVSSAGRSSSAPDADQAIRDFIRLRAALDDRLVVGALSGRYFGVVDGAPTPFFGVVSVVTRPRRTGHQSSITLIRH